MIFLHVDDKASDRVKRVAEETGGEVLGCDLAVAKKLDSNAIAQGLAAAKEPKLIVIFNARAENREERRSFEALSRIARLRGIDVHIAGDRSVEHVADYIVTRDEDMKVVAPGSSVGAQIYNMIQSEEMTELERVQLDIPTVEEVMAATGSGEEAAKDRIAWLKSQSVWVNNLYQVNVEYLPDDMAHVTIRRLDKQPIHNWVHFQRIKNQVLGEDCEAVEIFPKERDLVDAKHHYHLWGYRKGDKTFGLGFTGRNVDPSRYS